MQNMCKYKKYKFYLGLVLCAEESREKNLYLNSFFSKNFNITYWDIQHIDV